jgi:23S rRNA pseudouridine2605 synthase
MPPTAVQSEKTVSPTSTPERLQKIIARSGLVSRRRAEEMIKAGRVTVDGEAAHIGQKVDAESASLSVDGVPLPVAPGLVYYLVHKPLGVVSTVSDTHGRSTVVEIVPANPSVFPVGRLDADSTGLLVLTNDGALTNLVTHPRHGVTKTYEAMVEGVPSKRDLATLEQGVELVDGRAQAVSARLIGAAGSKAHIEVVMGEGRKREVRRMFEAIGHPVESLHRVAVGPIRDRRLALGEWRELTVQEVRSLYAAAAIPESR